MPITFLDEEEDIAPLATPTKRKITFLDEEEDETAPATQQPAAQPAYQYDPSGFRRKKPVAAEPKPEEQGILRQVADIPLGIARGGVTGIKMMTDILGADNAVSKSLSGVEGYMADLMSAQAKEDQQEISRIMKDAEDKGFGEQVKAGIKAFSIAPVDIMSQALGTMAPVIATGLAGSAAKLGALGMRAVQAGVGAGMGAGMIKGQIYNEVKNELVNSGIAEDAAEKAAVDAQSYGGKNLDQILLGAGLGAASTLGAEGIITRILTKQGTAPAAGVVSRVLKGGLTEAAPEAAQAAQEQLAKNVALQREGFDVDPSRGVVAAATMEAVAAAPLGGIAGAVERPAPIKTLAEENLEQTNEIARKVAENGAPLTASAIQDQAATNLRQDELAKQLEAQLEEEFVAVKEPTAAAQKPMSKDEFKAIYSQVAPEELDAAEAGFTNTLATAATEEARANAQNAIEAIKEVKATVTPPTPPVEPAITPAVTPAVPTAQPPITDATQEIIQPEGVRQEPQDGTQVQPTPQAGVGGGVFDTARGQEKGQVVPTTQPIISEIPATSELVGAEPTQPTIREVPEISPIVGAETAAIVEQETVVPAEPAQLPIEEPPVKISRGENFSMYGEYNVSIGDKKHRIYRDPERGYWYDADVQEEAVRSGSPKQGSPSLGLLSTETRKDAIAELVNKYKEEQQAAIPLEAPTPVTTPPVTEAVTPAEAPAITPAPVAETPAVTPAAEPTGISVGNRIKLGKSPQTYTIEEVIPQSATERELGEQYYSVKNERTGETQVVEARDLKQVKGKGARKIAAATRNEEYMRLAQDPEANREQLQRMVDEAATKSLERLATSEYKGGSAWLTPSGKWINVKPNGHFSIIPSSDEQLGWVDPMQAMSKLGFHRVVSVDGELFVEGYPLTQSLSREVKNSAIENRLNLNDATSSFYGGISKTNVRTAKPVIINNKGNIIPIEERFQPASPDIRRQAIDTTPEGILTTPPDQQYTFNEVFDVAYDMFGGEIPEGFTIVNDSTDKDFEFKAAYIPESGEIIVNLAYLNKSDDIRDTITHELGHYIFGDPEFRAAFDQFIASLSPEARAELDAYVETAYNKETGEIRLEEKMVRAFVDQFINEEQAPAWRSMLDAIKRFLNKLGFKFNISDRDAISVFTAALDRYKAGEAISREGGARLMAAEPAPKRRKEQVAGMEREETRYITTPKGILSMNTDVLREKFFDGTSVSPENTTQAWGYISRLLDIKSGNANELAGEINDTVDADLVAKREAAIAAGEKVDLEEDVSKRIGAAMFSVELMNYAGRLAEQGDTRMLKFMIRNVNSMPTDKYAGDISDAARALRTRLEYDVSGFSAYTTEQKAKVDRTAAVMFGTGKPSKEQSDAVKDAIDESEKTELGNAGEVAGEVEKVEKRTKRKITDKIEKVIGKGSLKGMIQAVKDTPLEKQQERGWIEKVVNDFLINAGLTPEAASTASKLYESLIAERFAAAKQKAFEDNLKKAAPWKNYSARNSRLAKDALNKVQAAIRTGVLDPEKNTESVIAAESGWSGFTKDQYQRIVQLDSIINDPKQDDVTRREAMADLNKVISDAKLPVRFKDALGAYYVGNALMGIPTLTVNIASPIGFTVRNLMTDVSKFAFTDPARIPVAFETFMESMRSWYDQTSYAFKNQIYLNDVVEYLQGQNVLRELFDKGKKQWAEGKYADGFVNMAVGMTQITGRVLSSLDQGAISMLENQNITRYALEALANTKGKVPKDKLKEFANMVIDTRRKTIAENIANGMSRDRAGVLADLAVKSEVISALAQYDVNPMNVLDASINDALQSVGRNKTLTIKGIEQSQKNISDEGFMSYWPIKLLEMVSAGAGREGSSMQIFAKMLYGFALVPARVFHNVAWFSPYGFIRLGVDKYKKNKGEDSPYAMSLQTEAQYRQRLTDSIAGSVAMLGLAALSSASTDEDEDKKFKIVITGNGPSATTDKQYFDSWMKKWKPYSVHIVVNGNIIPINIGRGGEALFFPIMLAGALDDWKIKQKQNLTKKEPEDLSAIAQMLGSSFFALAQRGPYAAFTKPLFDASKDGRVTEELASQAGFFGKTFIPVLGSSLSRNISDLFNDPVDRSSIEGAIYANTPVVGPWLGTKALNALGQPIRADDWGDKLYKLGVPVVFSFPKETPMNALNELILKQGSGPTIPTRANAQKRFGDVLTSKEFETYVREYGRVMSDKMFKNRTRLANMKPADYDDELEKYARGYSIDGIKIKGASDSAVLAVKRMRQ